jgi:hypothetical protein
MESGAKTIFGYEEDEIIGKSADILFIPEDIAKKCSVKREAKTPATRVALRMSAGTLERTDHVFSRAV